VYRILLTILLLCNAATIFAQDRSVLEDRRPLDQRPHAAKVAPPTPLDQRRVLVIGDSWAQYMWDDGSHNDLLDRFGFADHLAYSRSLGSDPGAGYTGPEVAVSGSEVRQWVDTANFPWIANTVDLLQANPSIDRVLFSIGGNDVLAGRSDGGWYKDMDLDSPGSEAALFTTIEANTQTIIDAILAVRPQIRVILSSYDYPNFNVGFWCFLYACGKRDDLSRDPSGDLITDAELNGMMVQVEMMRRDWASNWPRVDYDNSIGLMHHVYGDGVAPAWSLPRPGIVPQLYEPLPGGNPLLPSLRSAFRRPNGIDADPIHLDFEGYQHKIGQQTLAHLLPAFRGEPEEKLLAAGGGWTDGIQAVSGELRVGDDGIRRRGLILDFDRTGQAAITQLDRAAIFLSRQDGVGTSPFMSAAQGAATVALALGYFGSNPAVEAGDLDASSDLLDAAWVVGSAQSDGYTLRLELKPAALDMLESVEHFQLRLSFAVADAGEEWVGFAPASSGPPNRQGLATFAWADDSSAPVLDLYYDPTVAVADLHSPPLIHSIHPNPFNPRAVIRYRIEAEGSVAVRVYDTRGRWLRTLFHGRKAAGQHELSWNGKSADGSRVASGVYYVRVEIDGRVDQRKLTLVK
jgi:hypothetical protein